ncbi:methyltransferase domain-containing protein [Streptomyces sp. CHA1]|uniref:methyltransferase n=1 Tax=Streptomyces TaxID=1883 RepID=UPI001BFC1AB0|nr:MULTISPECIES: methyltransferase [unclassified Streptomyces]MBT3161264.1 methyltransferase domain-containing protein [Streptomyces sp. G11C]MCO6704263.1 methyltransferase domain-containing protein [Streptomyces sp. CHB9.2]MCO6710536.1 methyltransferase domain-containing protein [Streptomyces sp. CHA3]MCO6716332.1 methyltransferase domain-containing protein [Streptomyces sp. CHB19.2]MCO6722462.1 methyltransferase domain-containing protein [Streptomyces sp. Vc714c-19]
MTDTTPLTLDGLTPILFGHASFQYLNAGCELGLFELLQDKPDLAKEDIRQELGLAERATDVLLLGTTSLGITVQESGRYRNAPVIDKLFTDGQWSIFASVVAFEAHIVYEAQADFTESLRQNTNVGLRRIRGVGRDLYHRFHENPDIERVFYRYMRSWSELSNPFLLENGDFGSVKKVVDAGGGDAVNAIALAHAHPHLEVTVMEIPASGPIARRRIEENGLSDRITVHEGDMFRDPFPHGVDCVLFSHQMVIWEPEENIALMKKAHEALAPGGRLVLFSSISNDEGDGPLMAALDSVYFAALPAKGGMIYAWKQYEEWLQEAGFDASKISRKADTGWTPHGIITAVK